MVSRRGNRHIEVHLRAFALIADVVEDLMENRTSTRGRLRRGADSARTTSVSTFSSAANHQLDGVGVARSACVVQKITDGRYSRSALEDRESATARKVEAPSRAGERAEMLRHR
jgi:hypothetical protein